MGQKNKKGKVILVGAGPGDPGLVTLRGAEALQAAQVVVYDRLVNPEILHFAQTAERIFVGKKGGSHYTPQNEINRKVLHAVRRGKLVVRLKGGDPFVFGRGGEEATFLARHRIPFEVVPGVSAGIGAPAYAGIPLTDRRFASGVLFVTAHEASPHLSPPPAGRGEEREGGEVDWKQIAAFRGTLVLFMGVQNLEGTVKLLIRNGKPGRTPAAVIEKGTLADQRVIEGTLSNILRKTRRARVQSPALTVIGEVVRLRSRLAWFEKRPLQGKTVLVTRAKTQASELVRRLTESGAEVIEFPTIEILPPSKPERLDCEIRRLAQYDWVVFTSFNGVQFFFDRLNRLKRDARAFRRTRIAAIGEATAGALKEKGLAADLVPDEFTSEELFKALKRQGPLLGLKFLLARADIAPPDLRKALEKEGARVVEVEAYRTRRPRSIKRVSSKKIDYITFTSSSTVRNFFKLIPPALRRRVGARHASPLLVSIGPVTTRTLREYGFRPSREAKVHTIDGLVKSLCNGG